jgi:hypothetical protein
MVPGADGAGTSGPEGRAKPNKEGRPAEPDALVNENVFGLLLRSSQSSPWLSSASPEQLEDLRRAIAQTESELMHVLESRAPHACNYLPGITSNQKRERNLMLYKDR